MERYDYIIVGAGSAGCVLANRLSANAAHTVLLIEAGPQDSSPYIHMPRGFGKTLLNPKLTWYFPTEPEPGNAQRQYMWVRGKTLGGSSSVNGMIYVRGHPADYDSWEAMGNSGWGWKDMLRAFRAMENHELGADEFRGGHGPLHVSIQRYRTPLTKAILQAGALLGVPYKEDINRPNLEGIGYTPRTIWKGRRVSAAEAFLKPIRNRPNLRIVQGKLTREFKANREIILAAGALHSPKILQLSGVGPADHLRAVGVQVVCDSPGVGANLREHKLITLQHRLKQPYSYNHAFSGLPLCWNALKYFVCRTGVLADTYDMNAFIRTRPELMRPDVQLTISAHSLDVSHPTPVFNTFPGMQVFGYPLLTESAGYLRIRSNDPDAPLFIKANYLSTAHDRQVTVDMFRFMRRLLAQAPLQAFLAEETLPGPLVQSDEEIIDACARDHSGAHATGTCKMGQDALAVVDERLRVRGVDGLRVTDLSVMPTQVSGNTNGPVMAIAWRAAELIDADASRTVGA
jgi:choline dehydrogenase